MPSTIERRAAGLFSTALFRQIALGKPSHRADSTISELRNALCLGPESTNADVVNAAFDLMTRSYRTEYFYKNLIASKIHVGRHRASNSALLNELRIGDSVADCVHVNGAGVVYEIKTEFDSPEKLGRQIESYYRAFPYVNVVTHESTSDKYLRIVGDSPVGLISVGTRGQMSTVKVPTNNETSFDVRTMFNVLRLGELTEVLLKAHGSVPVVPNGRRYDEYLLLAQQIEPRDFQRLMQNALKSRAGQHNKALLFENHLAPLRSMLVQLVPDVRQEAQLKNWLNQEEH